MSRRVVMVLQARMGSTRLPGKSMLPLAGEPLVKRILERVGRCTRLDGVVVATTELEEDDVLAELATESGVAAFRGATNDLVDRHYQAAVASRADVIVRLPADNPVPEPAEIDRIVAYHAKGESDFSSNLSEVLGNGYPDGIGAEVFDVAMLEEVWRSETDPARREHVHLSFFDYATQTPVNPARYRVGTIECPADYRRPDLVLDVNTREQYEFLAALYEDLYSRDPSFGIRDIVNWYDNVYSRS